MLRLPVHLGAVDAPLAMTQSDDPEDLDKTQEAKRVGAPANRELPEVLRRLIGRDLAGCRIERLLGKGSMGAVFRGTEYGLGGRPVAIKVLLPGYAEHTEFLDRFHREAVAAAGLNSDHVVKIYRHGREGKFPYVVMELVEGGTLLQQNEGKCPPIPEVVRQLKQACEGLHAAEHQGLVHRDIKPANIMLAHREVGARGKTLRRRSDVKIVDFGIARPSRSLSTTQPGVFIGSPLYASPEQWRLDPVNHLSDMYSLGATFYQLLTGRAAPRGRTDQEVRAWTLAAERLQPREVNAEVPPALDAVIAKMTARAPADRYASFADIIDALNAIEEEWRKVVVKASPLRWVLVLAGVLVLAVAVGLYAMRPPAGSDRDRDYVLELVEDAKPEKALGKRADHIEKATQTFADLPEEFRTHNSELNKKLQRLAVFVQSIGELREIGNRPLERSDWKALRDKYGELRATETFGIEVEVAAVAEQALGKTQIRDALADLRTRFEAAKADALSELLKELDDRIRDCERKLTHADVAKNLGELHEGVAAEKLLVERILVCGEHLDDWISSTPRNVETLRWWLREPLPEPNGFASRTAAAEVRPKHDELQRLLDAVTLLDSLVESPLNDLVATLRRMAEDWPVVKLSIESVRDWFTERERMARARLTQRLKDELRARCEPAIPAADPLFDETIEQARSVLAEDPVKRLLGDQLGAVLEEIDKLQTRWNEARVRDAAATSTKPPVILPVGLPTSWPPGYEPVGGFEGLSWRIRDGVVLYQWRQKDRDPVDMLLVPGGKVENREVGPFLVDIRQLTNRRFEEFKKKSGSYQPTQWWSYEGSLGDAREGVGLAESLLFAVTWPAAENYAQWAGKELLTEDQWSVLNRLIGHPDAAGMLAHMRSPIGSRPRLPRSLRWPGGRDALAPLELGLRDIVRGRQSPYLAVGHSLFEPKNDVLDPLRDSELETYFESEPKQTKLDRTYRTSDIGFRCALPLVKR